MNKKCTIIIIVQSIIILILVIIFFKQKHNTDFINITEAFLKGEITSKEVSISEMESLIKKADINFIEEFNVSFNDSYFYVPFSHPWMLSQIYNKILSIIDLTKELEKEIVQNRDIDTEKLIIFSQENHFYIPDRLMSMIKLLNNPNYSPWEKQYILLLIKNYYLQRYISQFDESSIPLAYGQVMNYAESDTVNLGDVYQSQILFNVIDATGNLVVFENGDTIRYGKFEEKATKKGHNHKKGYMEISRRGGSITYEVNIDYYVK